MSRISAITCAAWIPKGVAKPNPDKIEITKEELEKLIIETKDDLKDIDDGDVDDEVDDEVDDDGYDQIEKEEFASKLSEDDKENKEDTNMEAEDDGETKTKTKTKTKSKTKDTKKEASTTKDDTKMDDDGIKEKLDDFESNYKFDDYDEEEDTASNVMKLGKLLLHANNDDDPYITIKDTDDVDSESGDHEILPSDNLIAVGHIEGDAAILEVYVYNNEENNLYVHHDILLPAVPLCMEWLNYDPGEENRKPGNLISIGSMSPVVDVWDLDIIDSMEPAYRLGKRGKKKQKIPGFGHQDAVLSLSWNRYSEHLLASGSVDQTVIIWDLDSGAVSMQLKAFEEKVQSIQWHHKEPQCLLTGACDEKLRMFDCRTQDTFKSWKLDGEVECVTWDTTVDQPYNCIASTESGFVYYIDARKEKPLWSLRAHMKSCTGLKLSPKCPGCLVTASTDKSVKIWDIASGKPEFIEEHDPKVGLVHALAAAPDSPFVFCMGGDNKENNFKVLDIRESNNVRSRFCKRVGLPADEEMEEAEEAMSNINISGKSRGYEEGAMGHSNSSGWKPNKSKFGKKKGGHLDKKKKKRY